MMKNVNTYRVGTKTTLDKIFINGIPVNALIDKGRCAIGATTWEIENKTRCTIITVPNISILLCKKAAHPQLDIVYGNVTPYEVEEYLSVCKAGHKIMTTPEGLKKIMDAAVTVRRYDEIINKWFLLLDEAHTFISEDYREDILRPFDYFWTFKIKSLITATPYVFSDPRFSDLDQYKIMFNAQLGTVTVVNSVSPMATLDWILKHPDDYPGNVHIFLNSVRAIRDAILRSGITDCGIFCANDKDGSNMRKLGELIKYYVAEPKEGEYKKYNFYTCKYFEGWDLYDDNATVILVTDIYQPHTMVGVKSKGKQAIGRLRNNAHRIIHVTNHKNMTEFKSIEHIRKDYLAEAKLLIKHNNEYAIDCVQNNRVYREDERLKYFADIDKTTNIATLNLMKLDQQINEAANNEIYNHIDYITKDWQDGYFDTEPTFTDIKLDTKTNLKRKSAANQLKEDYARLKDYRERKATGMVFNLFGSIEQDIKSSNPTAYLAEKHLDVTTMEKLKYNVKVDIPV